MRGAGQTVHGWQVGGVTIFHVHGTAYIFMGIISSIVLGDPPPPELGKIKTWDKLEKKMTSPLGYVEIGPSGVSAHKCCACAGGRSGH